MVRRLVGFRFPSIEHESVDIVLIIGRARHPLHVTLLSQPRLVYDK